MCHLQLDVTLGPSDIFAVLSYERATGQARSSRAEPGRPAGEMHKPLDLPPVARSIV